MVTSIVAHSEESTETTKFTARMKFSAFRQFFMVVFSLLKVEYAHRKSVQ